MTKGQNSTKLYRKSCIILAENLTKLDIEIYLSIKAGGGSCGCCPIVEEMQ